MFPNVFMLAAKDQRTFRFFVPYSTPVQRLSTQQMSVWSCGKPQGPESHDLHQQ